MLLLIAGGLLYATGRALVSPKGRYWAAQNLMRGSPNRVKPVVEGALAKAAEKLDLPRPYPQLFCQPDSTGRTLCGATIQLSPGTSVTQGNMAFTEALTDLGLRLIVGRQMPGGSVEVRYLAGSRTLIDLEILPPGGAGLDSLYSPPPGLEDVDVRARMAIVIDDYGRFMSRTRRVHPLPGTFTAAVHPGLDDVENVVQEARAAGLEVILDLPMEPKGYPDRNPGDDAILVDLSGRRIRRLVGRALDKVGDVPGVKTYMGSMAVEDRDVMRALLEELAERDLFLVDDTEQQYSLAEELGRETGTQVLTTTRSSQIDEQRGDLSSVQIRFNAFVDQCRARGYGVAIVRSRETTLEVLEEQIPRLAREGVIVVGLSEIMRLRRVDAHPR